jgi:3' terminal RNA ribose 2'-O-methyltransferase Hen1
MLAAKAQFERIGALEVSHRALEIARDKLSLERRPNRGASASSFWHGSLLYRDARLEGFDAAAVVEVIEHLDEPRLRAFERVLWQFARPKTVVLTTPNRDYNALFPTLPAGSMRHRDHRFEWSREEFQSWARSVADKWKYAVRFEDVGPFDEALGAPTQMGIWTRD